MGEHKNESQNSILVKFMNKHSELAKRVIGDDSNNAEMLWKKLTDKLNDEGPPIKSSNGWRKVWSDWKNDVRTKLHNNQQEHSTNYKLSAYDERVANIAGLYEIVEKNIFELNTDDIKQEEIDVEETRIIDINELKETVVFDEAALSNRKRHATDDNNDNTQKLKSYDMSMEFRLQEQSTEIFDSETSSNCETDKQVMPPLSKYEQCKVIDEKLLIEEVRKREVIYAKDSECYRNRKVREQAWMEISKAINIPADLCKIRWRSIRDKYVKEKQREANMKRTRSRLPRKLNNPLSFLKEHIPQRTIQSRVIPEPIDDSIVDPIGVAETFYNDVEETTINTDDVPTISTQSSTLPDKIKNNSCTTSNKQNNGLEEFKDFIGHLKNMANERFTTKRSQHDGFFQMQETFLNRLPIAKQDQIKIEILQTLQNSVREYEN